MRSFTTNLFIKILLFLVFAGCVWSALWGGLLVADNVVRSNIPSESLYRLNFRESWEFVEAGRGIADDLVQKQDPAKSNLEGRRLPTYYYRAEYPDGSSMTNAPQMATKDFSLLGSYSVYRSTQDGDWELLESNESNHHYPQNLRNYGNYSVTVVEDIFGTTVHSKTNEVSEDELIYAEPAPIITIYYGFDAASMVEFDAYWRQCRYYLFGQLAMLAGFVLAGAVAALWLLLAAGKKPADTEVHLLGYDNVWTEVTLALSGAVTILGIFGSLTLIMGGEYYSWVATEPFIPALWAGVCTLSCCILLLLLQSTVRCLKARRWLRNSLIFKLCHAVLWRPLKKLWDMARSIFDERAFAGSKATVALFKRQRLVIGVFSGWLVVFSFLILLADDAFFALVLLFINFLFFGLLGWWYISGNLKTYEQINQGMSDIYAEQMKSERTKTALVTNVSHDLKTPLTSIITYLDLLEKEELSDTARDYVTVLSQKTDRLKSMVSDLFDLAKSSSGNIPLDLETLDLRRLLEQTIADMRDGIDQSSLTLRTNFPSHEVYIHSDGKKLYRVFQNLIGNALKYSLDGTRVFIVLEDNNSRATVVIKNTAGYEMEFTAEEVLQRFARGDKSRTGEGSGLGLSIAESFATACGGDFKVEIDGDLFKVTASFPVTTAPAAQAAAPVVPQPLAPAPEALLSEAKTALEDAADAVSDCTVPQ